MYPAWLNIAERLVPRDQADTKPSKTFKEREARVAGLQQDLFQRVLSGYGGNQHAVELHSSIPPVATHAAREIAGAPTQTFFWSGAYPSKTQLLCPPGSEADVLLAHRKANEIISASSLPGALDSKSGAVELERFAHFIAHQSGIQVSPAAGAVVALEGVGAGQQVPALTLRHGYRDNALAAFRDFIKAWLEVVPP